MNDVVLMLEAEAFLKSFSRDATASMWVDSIIDVWDFVWVDSEEEEARSAESILAVDYHEIVDEDFATVIDNPIVWFTTSFDRQDHEWCENRNKYVPTLYIEVDPVEGITRQDADLASAFIGYLGT